MVIRIVTSVVLGVGAATGWAASARAAARPPLTAAAQAPDTARFAAAIRGRLAAQRLTGIRWPDLADVAAAADSAYRHSAWRPLWLGGGRPSPAARALIAAIGRAPERGLAPADFDADTLAVVAERIAAGGSAPDQEFFDLALTAAALRYVGALHYGRLDSRTVFPGWRIGPPRLDRVVIVDSLTRRDDPAPLLDRAEPQDSVYHGLKRWLARYRALAAGPPMPPLPMSGSSVKPGGRYPAAIPLRQRLALTGDLASIASAPAANDSSYDAATADAVRRFQRRHGLGEDGVLGRATLARLNEPWSLRVRQIELAMERRRWWPAEGERPAITVNAPAFRLTARRRDSAIVMKVIAGQAKKNETPVFTADLSEVIFLPYWEVPVSIMTKEIRPKAIRDSLYLDREGMDLLEGDRIIPATRQNVSRIGQDVRVRQRPGPRNALGRVKFLLASGYSVHLHDTPTPKLFDAARRDFSHGCIRVSDPVALARFVLAEAPGWTNERIAAAMAGDSSVTVPLRHSIAVAVTYETAGLVGEQIEFQADLYGRDRKLDRLLAGGFPNRKRQP